MRPMRLKKTNLMLTSFMSSFSEVGMNFHPCVPFLEVLLPFLNTSHFRDFNMNFTRYSIIIGNVVFMSSFILDGHLSKFTKWFD